MKIGYYKIFDIEHTASQLEIKKAFHRLAHQTHPDKPGGDAEQFKVIHKLYKILSDPYQKTIYDRSIASQVNNQPFKFSSGGSSTTHIFHAEYKIVPDDKPPGQGPGGSAWGHWFDYEE